MSWACCCGHFGSGLLDGEDGDEGEEGSDEGTCEAGGTKDGKWSRFAVTVISVTVGLELGYDEELATMLEIGGEDPGLLGGEEGGLLGGGDDPPPGGLLGGGDDPPPGGLEPPPVR